MGIVHAPQYLPLRETLHRAVMGDELGASSQWLIQMPNQPDSSIIIAGMAVRTERSMLGNAILPLYSRPPVLMAQAAMTLDDLSGGRFALGLGLGHRGVGEWMVGAGKAPHPTEGMREYLQIAAGLIRNGAVDHDGTWFSGHAMHPPTASRRPGMPIYVGAFGPRMLELAAELADGVVLWMCTAEYVRDQVVPALRRGFARRADGRYPDGRGFDVAAVVSAAVTDDPEEDRESFTGYLSEYLRVPTYRRLFSASGFDAQVKMGRADDAMFQALSVRGTPERVRARFDEYVAAGATHLVISPLGSAYTSRDRWSATLRAGLD
ncbi:LLM class flavin-dependent oxidoreductase [Nonomuraea sp. NPDC048916]|uniref:LLM class flavin-dependent oxidoreductase n=1 Tax=Nonomuraea sp. NPDC048916 TaxID=3154232 RepID=UPI0033EF9804